MKIKAIFHASSESVSPAKPYMEVRYSRYSVNDSHMTVLGSPQDPVYVPTVLEVSGNPLHVVIVAVISFRKDDRWFIF